MTTAGRNDPCPCGSGRKYKQCCLGLDKAAEQVHHRFGISGSTSPRARASHVWQVDLTPIPVLIETSPAARPAAVLVVEGDLVLEVEAIATPPSEVEEVAAELERVVARTAARTGRWPASLHVRDPDIARALSVLLAPRGVQVEASARLDELDAAAASLREHVGVPSDLSASSPETWRGWGLPDPLVAEVFRAAADYWRAAPWRFLDGDQPLLVEKGTARPWTCSIMGNMGEQFGLVLYAEHKDFFLTLSGGAALEQLTGPLLALSFEPASEIPPRMRREIIAARWEVAGPQAYPALIAMATPGGGLPRAAAEDLVRILRAIPAFMKVHGAALDPDRTTDAVLEWTAPDTGVRIRLDPAPAERSWLEGVLDRAGLSFDDLPLDRDLWEPVDLLEPCLPEGPGADPEAPLGRFDGGLMMLRVLEEREKAIVGRFAASLRDAGVSQATLYKHASNAGTFVESRFAAGIPVRAVTEYDLRVFLFDDYPRTTRDRGYRAEAMPVSLARFLHFLAESEDIVCPWAENVLADRYPFLHRLQSCPPGDSPDRSRADWSNLLRDDLIMRGLLHWPLHADQTLWEQEGPVEAELQREVQRRWLIWRDEFIRSGTTEPFEVRDAAVARQLAWEHEPHPALDGRTPLQAIRAERKREGRKGVKPKL